MTAWPKQSPNATIGGLTAMSLVVILAVISMTSFGSDDSRRIDAARPTAVDNDLPVGTVCTVQVARGQLQESVTGKIRKTTEKWIVLADETDVPILNKIPYISSAFKPHGRYVRNRETWIPRDSILYLTIGAEHFEHIPATADSATTQK